MTDSPSKKSLSQGTPKRFTRDRKETSPKRNQRIKTHEDLAVFQMAFTASMEIFELTKTFPPEDRYSLTDQIRRSSRSVCANLAEAWSKRAQEAVRRALAGYLEDRVAAGEIRIANAEQAASIYFDLFRSRMQFRTLLMPSYVPTEQEVREQVERAVKVFIGGIESLN